MKLFSMLSSKRSLNDGGTLWRSGREQFSYCDKAGRRVDFDVFFSGIERNAQYMIVVASITKFHNGECVSEDVKERIVSETKRYLEEKGEAVFVV